MSFQVGENVAPFLPTLTVEHGPREQLGRYFLDTAMALRRRGIELFISDDVHRLDQLGPDYDAVRPDRFPALDPDCAGFGSDHWLTIEGWTNPDQIAFVATGRLLELHGTLAEEIESFRLFYADPAQQRQPGDSVEITARNAKVIRGRVALQGGFWVNPMMRGSGLARIFPTICRWYCYTQWGVDHAIGFFHKDDAERLLPAVYGDADPERWIKFRGRWNDDSYLSSSSKAMLDAAIIRTPYIACRAIRVNDVLETKRVPSGVRQGKDSRS